MEERKLSRRLTRRQERLKKAQQRDFKRYGITADELKGANKVTNEEAKKGYPSLRKCLKYFKNYKGYLCLVILCMLAYTAINIITPIIMQHTIDFITVSEFDKAIKYAIIYLSVSIVNVFICFCWNIFATISFQKVILNLKTDLIDSVAKTKSKKFDEINSGTIISRVNTDADEVADVINTVIDWVAEIFIGIGFIIYMFFINVYMGLYVIVGIVLLFFAYRFYQNYNYKMRKKQKIVRDKQVGMTTEIARGMRDIKSLNIKDNILKAFHKQLTFRKVMAIDRAKNANGMWNAIRGLESIIQVGSIILGIYLLKLGMLTLGGLLLLIMYYGRVAWFVQGAQRIVEAVRNASVSAERISEVLNDDVYPKEKFGTKTIKKPKGEIEFKKVFFSYDKVKPVFENLNLKIEPNESVAFVGKSGQGKSTLLSLIPKLYELDAGKITIDGVDITSLSENGLRDLVTVVPQTPYIFNASIKENLKFVKSDLTDEEMIEVCKKAQIHDFIMSKEKGYDSLVGENGVILSGGQKQRLAIARALLKDSKIILLDEATSALDNENQSKIEAVIEELSKDHTVIIVAHRLSTVVNCNKIYMIEAGKIVDSGTHDYMMKNCKEYKKLYKIEKKSAE